MDLRKITIGPLKGGASIEALIRELFAGTKYRVTYAPNMGDYLLCRAAFVLPAVLFFRTMGVTGSSRAPVTRHLRTLISAFCPPPLSTARGWSTGARRTECSRWRPFSGSRPSRVWPWAAAISAAFIRQSIADPELLKKAQKGQPEALAPSIGCLPGCAPNLFAGRPNLIAKARHRGAVPLRFPENDASMADGEAMQN